MNEIYPVFYRNNKSLSFKVVEKISEIENYLPTIILYVDNNDLVCAPYIFKEVKYVKDINNIKHGFQYYFILRHDITNFEKLEQFMILTERDLQSGDYFPLGEIEPTLFGKIDADTISPNNSSILDDIQ